MAILPSLWNMYQICSCGSMTGWLQHICICRTGTKTLSVKIRCSTNACVKQIKVLLLSKLNSVTNRFWPSSGGALVCALCLTNEDHKFFIVLVTCSLTKMAYMADVLFPVEVASAGHCHRLHLLLTMNDWWWLWPDRPFSSVLGAITTRTQTRP